MNAENTLSVTFGILLAIGILIMIPIVTTAVGCVGCCAMCHVADKTSK
jgi:hypothetical protein